MEMSEISVCINLMILYLLIIYTFSVSANKKDQVNCKKNSRGYTECTCPKDPITERYPDPDDKTCDFYFLCHLSRARRIKCNPGEAFHPKLRECLPRQRIPDNICRPLVDCPLYPNRYMEDKRDCTKYYLCYHGQYTHWSCPEEYYFEPKAEKCDNDAKQAEACIVMAKRTFHRNIGYEEPPPKTSVALDQAKKYMEGRKKTRSLKKKG